MMTLTHFGNQLCWGQCLFLAMRVGVGRWKVPWWVDSRSVGTSLTNVCLRLDVCGLATGEQKVRV